MFVAGHAAAGALVASQVPNNPLLAFVLALVSHFLLDIVPHGDAHNVRDYYHGGKQRMRQMYNIFVTDTVFTIIFISFFFAYTAINHITLAWALIGGVLPDLVVAVDELVKSNKLQWFKKMHFRFHNALTDKFDVKPLPGAIGQIIVIAAMLLII